MSQDDNKDFLVDLEIKFDRLITNIDGVKEKQEEMLENINKIKEAVYNPDEGLYARLKALENWKNTSSKMIWTLFTSMVGLICAFILRSL
tara:strand:+ start:7093 stop:7362 length:270 start_codon:yes stop_codon:yes gene_type:complete